MFLYYLKITGVVPNMTQSWPEAPIWSTPSPTASYIYTPLDSTKSTVRLLQLQLQADGTVQGYLTYHEHEKAPPYRSLSYMWGTEFLKKSICIDGRSMIIRKNLFDFLQVYKNRHLSEYIWIDQICIDQDSTGERNHQVQQMAEIYRRAEEVIIWISLYSTAHSMGMCGAKCINCHAANECLWHRNLARNPYWNRIWIIQEVLLARRIQVYIDQTVLAWSYLEPLGSIRAMSGVEITRFQWLCLQKGQGADEGGAHLRWQTLAYAAFGGLCQDPRDSVYGLQSLLRPQDRLIVDYAQCRAVLFVDAAMKMCNDGALLSKDILWWIFRLADNLKVNADPNYFRGISAHHTRSYSKEQGVRALRLELLKIVFYLNPEERPAIMASVQEIQPGYIIYGFSVDGSPAVEEPLPLDY